MFWYSCVHLCLWHARRIHVSTFCSNQLPAFPAASCWPGSSASSLLQTPIYPSYRNISLCPHILHPIYLSGWGAGCVVFMGFSEGGWGSKNGSNYYEACCISLKRDSGVPLRIGSFKFWGRMRNMVGCRRFCCWALPVSFLIHFIIRFGVGVATGRRPLPLGRNPQQLSPRRCSRGPDGPNVKTAVAVLIISASCTSNNRNGMNRGQPRLKINYCRFQTTLLSSDILRSFCDPADYESQ